MRGWAGTLLFVVLASCGSSPSSPPPDGGAGAGGTGTAGTGGTGGSSDVCANLACLQQLNDLMVSCTAGEYCVVQRDSLSGPSTSAYCYDNGVKVLDTTTSSIGTLTTTFQVKKGDAPCYTRTFVTMSGASAAAYLMTSVARDPAGNTLVTASRDINNVYTVTCPGGPPTVFVASCGFPTTVLTNGYLVPATPPAGTEGACTY